MYRKSISIWAEKYGCLTAFSFMLYSELWEDEIHVLGNGIKLALYAMEKNSEFQLLVEEVDTDKALAMKSYRGTSLQIVFPNSTLYLEDLVREAVDLFSISYAIKYDFIDSKEVVNFA
tara:strand:- start:3 stop:356 length:354 start_codon:yes stop_codon:yes gene_type:complete